MAVEGNSAVAKNKARSIIKYTQDSKNDAPGQSIVDTTKDSINGLRARLLNYSAQQGEFDSYNGNSFFDKAYYTEYISSVKIQEELDAQEERFSRRFDYSNYIGFIDVNQVTANQEHLDKLQVQKELLEAELNLVQKDVERDEDDKKARKKRDELRDEVEQVNEQIKNLLLGNPIEDLKLKHLKGIEKKQELQNQKVKLEEEISSLKKEVKSMGKSGSRNKKNNQIKALESELKGINKQLKDL